MRVAVTLSVSAHVHVHVHTCVYLYLTGMFIRISNTEETKYIPCNKINIFIKTSGHTYVASIIPRLPGIFNVEKQGEV